jgi:hypothetical protein
MRFIAILQGAVVIFGYRLKATLYHFCAKKDALIRPSTPRFKMACTLDSFLGGLSDELLQTAEWKKESIEVNELRKSCFMSRK